MYKLVLIAVILLSSACKGSGEKGTVVIVGGGIAGLTAGANLCKAGFQVNLLEAKDRIGGRAWTAKFGKQNIEMGAEFVLGGTGNIVFDLMYPLGVLSNLMHSPDAKKGWPTLTGSSLNNVQKAQVMKLFRTVFLDPDDWKQDAPWVTNQGEWAHYVIRRFRNSGMTHLNNSLEQVAFEWVQKPVLELHPADNLFQISFSDKGEQYEHIGDLSFSTWIPQYGFDTLIQYILTDTITPFPSYSVPPWIHLSEEVSIIALLPNRALVYTNSGNVYHADHVIFTPSLGVLKEKHKTIFYPPLSVRKERAIKYLGFGTSAKVYLEFAEPWWDSDWVGFYPLWNDFYYENNRSLEWFREDVTKEELLQEYNGFPLWCRGIFEITPVPSGSAPNFLRIWVSGIPSKVVERFEPEYLIYWMMQILSRFIGVQRNRMTQPLKMFRSNWYSDLHFRGTYSYRTPRSEIEDVWARDLAQAVYYPGTNKPGLAFAGEATHPRFFKTAHGALETGLREFKRINSYYQ